MSLTNFLLLLILAIFSTYTFMNWKSGVKKEPKSKIALQFFIWTILFLVIVFIFKALGFVNDF